MKFSNEMLEGTRREKKVAQLVRAKSLDTARSSELSPAEIKILLSQQHNNEFAAAVARQQLLADKRLFDPFKYFGSPNFNSFEESFRYHSRRLNEMFALPGSNAPVHPRTPVRVALKGSLGSRKQQNSPLQGERGREGLKRTMGKSPKGYVKENKQNFMRLNLNNMQKMRVKLKLNKK